MKSDNWTKWLIQAADKWGDLAPIIRNTGVRAIDSDHQQLVKYTLELNSLIKEFTGKKFNISQMNRQHIILTEIYKFAKYHFAREEELMRDFLISDRLQHKEHTKILNMLEGFINEFDAGKLTTAYQLKFSITEWVINHVNNIDCQTFSLKNFKHILSGAREWNDLSHIIKMTNIPEVDKEHRELVECTLRINHVLDLNVSDNEKLSMAKENLYELKDIVTNHFDDEERIGEKYRFPFQDVQKEQHAIFTSLLNEQINKSDKELLSSLQSFKNLTIEWWINHINQLDYATLSIFLRMEAIVSSIDSIKEIDWLLKKTNDNKVNAEHINIFRKIEDLEGCAKPECKKSKEDKIKVFNDLIDMCRHHAKMEEELMLEKQEPLLEIHQIEHKEMILKFERLLNEYQNGISILSQNLINKLLNIWLTHINKADIEVFGDYEND